MDVKPMFKNEKDIMAHNIKLQHMDPEESCWCVNVEEWKQWLLNNHIDAIISDHDCHIAFKNESDKIEFILRWL